MKYRNPIIPGFNPDPSVCRVGQDYYLVTSTFEYFPGVPIFHSRDLVNWRQIGHCLTRHSQLVLDGAHCSHGIFAPTLRYHNGLFYMIVGNVSDPRGVFFVTAADPAGEWSDPTWVSIQAGDPSLFWDDDGRCYVTGNTRPGIVQQEMDPATGKALSEDRLIWAGTGGRWPEGPHLYKINGLYYLMIAEGGTEYGHMETIARGQSPWGPWKPCPRNPILTHRNLGLDPIQGTGHADLIQAHDGSWWMVTLAFRTVAGKYHHLGRETFLAPVTWDASGWPVVNATGTLGLEMDVPGLPPCPWPDEPVRDDFASPDLALCWNFLRNPQPEDWSLSARPGFLRLVGSARTLDDLASPSFVGRRQTLLRCEMSAQLDFQPASANEEAGLTVLANATHHNEIAVTSSGTTGQRVVQVRKRIGDLVAIVASQPIGDGPVELSIQALDHEYTFSWAPAGSGRRHVLATGLARYISTEVAGGFTGVYVGMYATGQGRACSAPADFDWFECRPGSPLKKCLSP